MNLFKKKEPKEKTAPVEEAAAVEEAAPAEETAPVEEEETVPEKKESDDVELVAEPEAAVEAEPAPKKDRANRSRESIKQIMKSHKISDRIPLGENIYSLLIVSPTYSWPFIFCCGVYVIKIAILIILLSDISFRSERPNILVEETKVTIVKYCLIPVAVAMQEDMIYSFYFFANAIYSPKILKICPAATKDRFLYSYFLRTIDGILSLFANYFTMLITTDRVLSVFLNFAALQFLYSIDDIFYELVTQGFFGEYLQDYSQTCKQITLKRRLGKSNKTVMGCLRMSWMDSVFYCASILVCVVIYALVSIGGNDESGELVKLPTEAPTVAPSAILTSVTTFFNTTDDDGF